MTATAFTSFLNRTGEESWRLSPRVIFPKRGPYRGLRDRRLRHLRYPMPYLRVYSQAVPIEQKRVIAEKLIEITLRTFHLRAQERNRITIQFQAIPRGSDFTLEVIGHDLTEERRKAFAEEASAMLTRLVPVKPSSRIARLLGIKWAAPLRIVLEFDELSPAISDPFVVDLEPDWAA